MNYYQGTNVDAAGERGPGLGQTIRGNKIPEAQNYERNQFHHGSIDKGVASEITRKIESTSVWMERI